MFFYIVFTLISTTSGLWSTGNTRKYRQIDVNIYQCVLSRHFFAKYDWPLGYLKQCHNKGIRASKLNEASFSTDEMYLNK